MDHLPDARDATPTPSSAALLAGELGVWSSGRDPDDTADPAATPRGDRGASFVVALELRETDVTGADVVFPVAPVVDKAARS